MAYLDYPGLAYFKSLLDQTYLRVDYDGDTTIAGHVTFTNPITGDIDGRAKKDWLGQQFDTTYLKDIQPDASGALKLILGNGQVSHLVTDTTVTQERSSANETYPVLLCYDENATANQIAKKVKYGHDVQINPAYGYIYAQGYVEKHPAYNRTTAQSSRAEWMLDFRDSVLNPVGQIYSYIDPSSQGGEHRMELRLYGNPHTTNLNLPNYNFETDTVSLGVSSTKGDKLTFFGYAPSTPIYLEDETTLRKSTVRGDQYGRDIITRDWLNLNGSITGLVHTYMDETIDGLKTFLKTVTIDSGNDNAKAGLNVQGDVNIDSGDASKPSNFYVQGNSHVHGNEDIDGNLNVDGNADVGGKLTAEDLEATDDLTVGDDATIGGDLSVPNGTTTTKELHVTDDATIDDNLHVGGNETVDGNVGVAGVINKIYNNTTKEYVTYVTEQPATRQNIAANLIDTSKGLKLYGTGSDKKIGVNAGQSLSFDSNGILDVDFDQMPTDKFEKLLQQLHLPLYVGEKNGSSTIGTEFYVATNGVNDTTDGRGRSADKPWATIAYATETLAKNYNISTKTVYINVAAGTYTQQVSLPLLQRTTGRVIIRPITSSAVVNVEVTADGSDGCFSHSGGAWCLDSLNIKLIMTTRGGASSAFPWLVASSDSTGYVAIRNCNLSFVDNSTVPDSSHGRFSARLISANGGRIYINNNGSYATDTTNGRKTAWSGTKGNANVIWMYLQNGGLLIMERNGYDTVASTYQVTGSFSYFCYCIYSSTYRVQGQGPDPLWSYNVSSIGADSQGYHASSGGTIATNTGSITEREDYFPRGYQSDTTTPVENYFKTAEGSWVSPGAGS